MAHSQELVRNKSAPLSGIVREVLLSDILSLRLPPHTRVSENDIARRFGVSRQPVREAILSLGDIGLLRIEGHRSTLVMPISRARAEGAHFARTAIEVAIAKRAAEIRLSTPSAFSRLLQLQRDTAVAAGRVEFLRLDEAFHRACEAAANANVYPTLTEFRIHTARVCAVTRQTPESMLRTVEEHELIARAITDGDEQGATDAMRAHLDRFHVALEAACSEFPSYFGG